MTSNSRDPGRRIRLERTLLFVVAIGFLLAATHGRWFATLDRTIYDAWVSSATVPLSDDIIVVGIDQRTLDATGRWPWPREVQAELIEVVAGAQPRAILVDVLYAGSYDEAGDKRMRESFESADTVALPVALDVIAHAEPALEVLPPVEFMSAVDVLGHIHVELDSDAIVRGVYLYQGIGEARWPHVALALAQRLDATEFQPRPCEIPAEFTINIVQCEFYYVPFVGPPGSVREVSALDVANDGALRALLKDRVVLIGFTASGLGDQVTVPVSSQSRPMTGVEFNASLYNAIVQDELIRELDPLWWYLVGLLCVAGPALLLPTLRAGVMLSVAVVFALLPLSLTGAALVFGNLHLPLGAAALTCLLIYPAWSWRRQRIAARFLEGELSRVQLEHDRWAQGRALATRDVATRLAALLGATLTTHVSEPLSAASFTRDRSLSTTEQDLIERTLASSRANIAVHAPLPGEVLAAQIRTLQMRADEVRLGRDIGLLGIEQMASGVLILSELGEVIFVNSAARELLGPAAVVGAEFEAALAELTMPLGQSRKDLYRRVVIEGRRIDFESVISELPVFVAANRLPGEDGLPPRWLINIADMSDVRSAQRDRDEALAFLSHDLRSPMVSVLAAVRNRDDGVDVAAIERYAQRALAAGDQFVALSRAQAQEQLELYDCEMGNLADNAVEQMYAIARSADISVRSKSEPLLSTAEPTGSEEEGEDQGIWVLGNGELLERALINLISNAIKYSEPGSRVDVAVVEHEAEVLVSVSDQGLGIPAAEIDRVFEAYYRSVAPALASRRGAGLGLRFVKTVAERHGGSVSVESQQGVGSVFTLVLPKVVDEEA